MEKRKKRKNNNNNICATRIEKKKTRRRRILFNSYKKPEVLKVLKINDKFDNIVKEKIYENY